jgi:hypothetical protein
LWIAEPVIVAVTVVASPAWLLGCHDVVTRPVELSEFELGEKVVVNPEAGYPPAVAEKETGTPACAGVTVAVTV